MNKRYIKLLGQQQDYLQVNPKDLQKVGKHMISKQMKKKYKISTKMQKALSRYYIKFEKQAQKNQFKIPECDQKPTQEWIIAFFSNLVESSMKGYILVGVTMPFFKQLVAVDYSQMKRLELVKCNLYSLQPLSWLNTDYFETIYLKDNFITSLEPLHKTRWRNFLSISLDKNPITSYQPLCKTYVPNKAIPSQRDQFFIYMSQQIIQVPSISFLLKLQKTQTRFIGLQIPSKGHISQPNYLKAVDRFQTIPKAPVQMQRQPDRPTMVNQEQIIQ